MSEQRQQEESEMVENSEDGCELQEEQAAASDGDEAAGIREELEEALREKDQFRTMALRAQADLTNFKRRASEEQLEVRRTANTGLLLKVLSVMDDLERALALVPEDAVAEGWLDGLKLIKRNLDHLLDSEGVRRIDAYGKPFAPWEHEAVTYEEAADCDADTVVRVVREGYTLQNRVLRAAQVVVSKAPVPDSGPETDDQEA
jgi:molecular chaperone GrpE